MWVMPMLSSTALSINMDARYCGHPVCVVCVCFKVNVECACGIVGVRWSTASPHVGIDMCGERCLQCASDRTPRHQTTSSLLRHFYLWIGARARPSRRRTAPLVRSWRSASSGMPLSLATLEALQSEYMADDVPIDFTKMSVWTEDQVARFFESGGAVEPGAASHLGTPARTPLGRKPRIAVLHGTASNEAIVKIQLGKLWSVLRELGDVFVVEGDFVVDEDNPLTAEMRKFFGSSHVLKEYGRPTMDSRRWRTYDGLDESFERLEHALEERGGADVLIGFSQGANFTSLLCASAAQAGAADFGCHQPVRAAVLLAPACPGWVKQKPDLFATPLTTPALVGYSDSDMQVITPAGCGPDETARLFSSSSVQIVKHGGPGHRPLPKDPDELARLIEAIRNLITAECPQS